MKPLNTYIVAPSLDEAQAVAFAVNIGSDREVRSNWWEGPYLGIPSKVRENRSAFLSTPQLRELADKISEEVHGADLLISVHNRNAGSSRGSAFWAGYAYARRIPVIVVGAFDEVALYGSRVYTAELADVRDVLRKVEKLTLSLRSLDALFRLEDGTRAHKANVVNVVNLQPGESHESNRSDGSQGPDQRDGSGSRSDGDVGSGSHI